MGTDEVPSTPSGSRWTIYTFSLSVIAIVAIVAVIVYAVPKEKSTPVIVQYPENTVGLAAATQLAPAPTTGSEIWAALPKEMRGDHYTLNIHGKKDGFSCPPPEYDSVTGQQVYGNSLFVPENGNDIQIIMESGNVKGKYAATAPTYGVTDWCANAYDGDAGVVRLPPRQNGYLVVARTLGTPTDNPNMTVEGGLYSVQDEYGNDLLVLGLVTSNGFQTPSYTFTRSKGKSTATDITGLFEWSGSVCYFNGTNYCTDTSGADICVDRQLCCTDTNADGIWDTCNDATYDSVALTYVCPDGTTMLTAACRDYSQEWVFNIADFVQYLWSTQNNGVKLVQVRFYPR